MSCICGGSDHGPGCGVPVPSTSGYILAVTGVGAPGSKGDKGDPGRDGYSVSYAGTVLRFDDLPASADPGDMWWVETPSPTTAFIWDEVTSGFVAAGRVQGDAGADSMVPGPAGSPGAPGKDGVNGKDGATGATGSKGDKGDVGATGPAGSPGNVGATGAQGIPGPVGPAGPAGGVGPQGEPGKTGASGSVGPQGVPGATGATGSPGPAGPAGEQGAPGLGIRFCGSVATVDDLEATATQGDLYNVETPAPPHGWVWDDTEQAWIDAGQIQGPAGSVGATGETGAVGPPGIQGEPGVPGQDGADGAPGAPGKDGVDGQDGADSMVPGPAGPPGRDGVDGQDGAPGADGAPGQDGADSTVPGPAGADGAPGPIGPAGPNAVSADAGNTSKLGTDGLIFTPAASVGTGFLPLTGGDMTGTITLPSGTVGMAVKGTNYNLLGGSGGVAFRNGTSNIINHTAAEIAAYVPITASGGAVGVRFGSGGPSLSKSGTSIASSAPITVAAAPTADTQLANKAYVDSQAGGGGVPANVVTGTTSTTPTAFVLWVGTQAEYDAIATPLSNTIYYISA